MGIDPTVTLVEPYFPKATVTPTRRTRRNDLKRVMFLKIIAGGNQLEGGLVVDGFANEEIQELRSFIPPVAKELSIKGRDNDRFDVGNAGQMFDLFYAAGKEVAGMMIHGAMRPARHIRLFMRRSTRDPVIFDPGELSLTVSRQERAQIVQVQVKTDVSIKIAISRIARITFLSAPDLFARLSITTKNGGSCGREKKGGKMSLRRAINQQESRRFQSQTRSR